MKIIDREIANLEIILIEALEIVKNLYGKHTGNYNGKQGKQSRSRRFVCRKRKT